MPPVRQKTTCSQPGCRRKREKVGLWLRPLCRGHRRQQEAGEPLRELRAYRRKKR